MVRKAVSKLDIPAPGAAFDPERYRSLMRAVYAEMQRQDSDGWSAGMVHEPEAVKISPDMRYERLVDYPHEEVGEADAARYYYVIRGEGERLLMLFTHSWRRTDDEDMRDYEAHRLVERLDELLMLPGTVGFGDQPTEQLIYRFLCRELLALRAHINLHLEDDFCASSPLIPSRLARHLPSALAPVRLHHTESYWRQGLNNLLDDWKVAKHNPTPDEELIQLLDRLRAEADEGADSRLEGIYRRGQIILLLMILRRIDEPGKKKRLYEDQHAEEELNRLDQLLRSQTNRKEDGSMIFEYVDRLDRRQDKLDVDRFSLVGSRHRQIDQLSSNLFSTIGAGWRERRDASSQLDSDPPGSAIQRLKDTYMTIPQIADFLGVADRTVRTLLKKHDIPTLKRGNTVLVKYDDFAQDD